MANLLEQPQSLRNDENMRNNPPVRLRTQRKFLERQNLEADCANCISHSSSWNTFVTVGHYICIYIPLVKFVFVF